MPKAAKFSSASPHFPPTHAARERHACRTAWGPVQKGVGARDKTPRSPCRGLPNTDQQTMLVSEQGSTVMVMICMAQAVRESRKLEEAPCTPARACVIFTPLWCAPPSEPDDKTVRQRGGRKEVLW